MHRIYGVKAQFSSFPFNDSIEIIYEKDENEIDNSTVLINVEYEAFYKHVKQVIEF